MTETIVAIATPPGRGGVGILRLSGPDAHTIGTRLAGDLPQARRAGLRSFRTLDGDLVDEGLVLVFPAPNSFTGEDVVELHGHGGPVVLDLLVQAAVAAGARVAEPGEFSRRAFLNGRLDLVQAEAVADLIESSSAQAARAAARSLGGEFSRQVHAIVEALIELRTWVEAALDFPEEEVDFLDDAGLLTRANDITARFDRLGRAAAQGRLLRDGLTIVLAGAPNAGKSSLLNRLAGYESAIVTDLPGTTRDVLRETITLHGMPVHVVDTAGLRASEDVVEAEGVRRARKEMAAADRVLLIVDAADPGPVSDDDLPDGVPVTLVRNKIDLVSDTPSIEIDAAGRSVISLSALSGAGLNLLVTHLEAAVGYAPAGEGVLSARRRHLVALETARRHVDEALVQLRSYRAAELMAEELRLAQEALGEITGEFTSDDLLGRVFSSFCIGK